jgi:hypothetical protein
MPEALVLMLEEVVSLMDILGSVNLWDLPGFLVCFRCYHGE